MPTFKYRDPGSGNFVTLPLLVPAGVDEVWVHNDSPTDPNVQLWVDLDAPTQLSDPYTTAPVTALAPNWGYYAAPWDDCTVSKIGGLVVAGGGLFVWITANYTLPASTPYQFATVPVGYRPSKNHLVSARCFVGSEQHVRVDVASSGALSITSSTAMTFTQNQSWVGLGGNAWRV